MSDISLADAEDFEVSCEKNRNLDQVRVRVRNHAKSRRTVAGVRLVRQQTNDSFVEILTHVLEDGSYDFQSTDLESETYLSVILQLGQVEGIELPTVFSAGRQEIPKIDDPSLMIQAIVGGNDPELYTITPASTLKWDKDTSSQYWIQHKPAPPPTPEPPLWRRLLKIIWSWVSTGVGAAATAAVTAVVIGLLAILRGWVGGGTTVADTATSFWEPPAIEEARWHAEAVTAACSTTGALGGAALSCQELVDGTPAPGVPIAPCFAVTTARYVCASDPWAGDLVLAVAPTNAPPTSTPVVVSTVMPTAPTLEAVDVWALELADGRRCVLDFAHGADRYRCADSGTILGPDATTSLGRVVAPDEGPWTIQVRPEGGGRGTNVVKIKLAWGVFIDAG